VIKNQKIKNQQLILKDQLNQAKLEALRAQINPHFTFNAINSIQNYIIDEDTDNALHYLGVFSKLIRQTLENSFEKFVPLNLELDFLHNYISVQQIRFDTVKVFWNVSENINVFKIGIPPLIIQPYIENVFEHAFDNSIEDQNVEVNFKIQSNQLICEVVDNGIGIQKGKNSSLHRSRGLEITKSRFDLMNEDLKSNEFQIDFFNLKEVSDRKGTLIRIFFPLYNLDSSSTSE
jgi:LytS/YehU family sensor histidine kinase